MPATTTSISGILSIIATLQNAPPSASEPVSPINTFAGYPLNNKNPRVEPVTTAENPVSALSPAIIDIQVKKIIIIVVTLAAKPSKPSVRFKLFVQASIINTLEAI